MPVPVHILSGFLGAGKTTALLDQLGQRAGERVAVLVNDFGEAAIDQQLVDDRGQIALTEIRGACVCCSAPEGFQEAIGTLLDEVGAERIFIEPTGLARPADLIDTLQRGPYRDRVALGPLVVLVDPSVLGDSHPILEEQVEAADVLVANRVDLASQDDLRRFRAWAEALWPAPLQVYETTFGKVPTQAFDWPAGTGPRLRKAHEHDHDHHDKGITARTWVWPPDARFSKERLTDALARLAMGQAGAALVRFKGLMHTQEGEYLLEIAGGHVHERPTGYRRDSRADVMMATADPEVLDRAGAWLHRALLTDDEQRVDAEQIEVVRPDGTRRTFARSEVMALPGQVRDITPLVPKRAGSAASFASLLDEVGVTRDAEVVVVASDGFATPPVPIEALSTGLLVHSLEDAPLPDSQGGPFRLLIPGDAGPGGPCANVKGVVRIVLRRPSA